MHGHMSGPGDHPAAALPTLEAADGMMCVGPDGVHACGHHGSDDGICRHDNGVNHPCGNCPNCRIDEPEAVSG